MVQDQRLQMGGIWVLILILGFVSTVYSDTEDPSLEPFIGTWLRQGTYINGALEHTTPATMVLNRDSFYSTGTCSTSGSLTFKDENMTMKMTQSSCPGGLILPFTVTFTYQISDEGKKMTLQAGNVMEKYQRKPEVKEQPSEKTGKPKSEPQPTPDLGDANKPPGAHAKPSQNKVLIN